MKEVEILYELADSKESVIKTLSHFDFKGQKQTLDIYFYDPLRKDLLLDENGRLKRCFRLRKKDDDYYLTYKIDYFDEKDVWLYSDEHEVSVGDFETTEKIIEHLGLKELVRVDNEKYIFLTDKYEIVVEDVKNLGMFLEVELLDEEMVTEVEALKNEIRKFVRDLGIAIKQEMNAGKPEMLLKRQTKV